MTEPTTLVSGIVSSHDLTGDKPLRVAAKERIHHHEITVAQVMFGLDAIRPLSLYDVSHVTVRAIVQHLIEYNRQHALVLDPLVEGEYVCCGIFSAAQISRQLGCEITVGDGIAQSFAELSRLII